MALEPFWLMSCAVMEQQRNFVPPRELVKLWVVLAQVRTVSLVDTTGSLAVLRYLFGKVEASGASDYRDGGGDAGFVPNPAVVCRLARETMTAISMALFPQVPDVVVESLVHPLDFTFRTDAQQERAQPAASSKQTASPGGGGDDDDDPAAAAAGAAGAGGEDTPVGFEGNADDWSAGSRYHFWYRLLLDVNPIALEHAVGKKAAAASLPSPGGGITHGNSTSAGDSNGSNDSGRGSMSRSRQRGNSFVGAHGDDATFQPGTIDEDLEEFGEEDSTSDSDEESTEDTSTDHDDGNPEATAEITSATMKVVDAADAAWQVAGQGVEWMENAALRSVPASVLAELVAVMPERLFREHLAHLTTFAVTTLVMGASHGCLLYTSPSPRDRG